jgi:alpha-amylase/alpha-mannosidase (GH57 family)
MTLLVCHAHFYQPPREDPWTGTVPAEPSAAPNHDWNSRITRECYAALAAIPVGDDHDEPRRTLNGYDWLSFDAGPTLVRWLERERPDVVAAMQAGDRHAIARTGHGNAIAAPYHHIILPLASRREKVTEVRWGVREFRRIFGREPLGIWLPETAVDRETLEVVAAEGLRYTILAPDQVAEADPAGRPLRWSSGDHTLLLCCYDGPISHDIAFGDLLQDGNRFADRLMGAAAGRDVLGWATDGETFGHHHRWGDLGLGAMLDRIRRADGARLVSYDAVTATVPATGEAALVEPSSWSCSHGVGRWQADCGCRMDPATSQGWRVPLRQGLDALRRGVDDAIATSWQPAWGNRYERRNALGPDFTDADLPAEAQRLLEADRHAMVMFTSCASFFDDIARIEPWLVLRHAVRAMELLPADLATPMRATLEATLATAVSNEPGRDSAADLLNRPLPPDDRD